jgi:transglutaminase-like putative cysteine protease
MKIRIRHRTTYSYSEPVGFRPHRLMIRPREGHDLHIDSSILDIAPAHTVHWIRDVNGNSIAIVDFTEKSARLMFYSELVLSHYDTNPFDFILEESAYFYPFVYDANSQPELAPYIQLLYPEEGESLQKWARQFWKPDDRVETLSLLQNVNQSIRKNFQYAPREEKGVQTCAETLEKKSGSCRDFAVLLLETCRFWGLAARFVSGYMLTDGTDGNSTHAWTEVYLPGAGWKGFDPTTGLMTGATYVTVAVSRHPERASPIIGSYIGPGSAFLNIQVDVQVEQLDKSSSTPLTPTNPMRHQPRARDDDDGVRQVQQVAQQNPFPAPAPPPPRPSNREIL